MSVFSLRTVIEKLQSSLEDEDDLDMDSYLAAYKELCKFFQGLGSVFGFINSDVKSKIEILEEYRRSDDVGDSYATLNSMIEYEKEAGTIADEKKTFGEPHVTAAAPSTRVHRQVVQVFDQRQRRHVSWEAGQGELR